MTLTSVTAPAAVEIVTDFPRVEEGYRSYGAGPVRYRADMKPTAAECRERAAAYLAMARHQEVAA